MRYLAGVRNRHVDGCAAACFAIAGLLMSVAVLATTNPAEQELPWGGDPPPGPAAERARSISSLGRQMFFDIGLSASRTQSCASCHDPAMHFGPPNALSVQLGGPKRSLAGTRAVPSLAYLAATPFFTEHYYESEDEGDESVDQGPAGGRAWDGRFDRARDQAAFPLLAANEMANADQGVVVARAAAAPYAAQMKSLYGDDIFRDVQRAFTVIGEALEAFQETQELFSPYSSKYDAFLRHQVGLSKQELRGLSVFNDPAKGNCASCHKSAVTPGGLLPKFTDAGFVAIGVPRNKAIPANYNPDYFDLGACGPYRKDLADRSEFCGMFKAPTLRNVAVRKSFYHNGVFHTLRDAVAFYATRDTNPERWYPLGADGRVRKFNDLPERYWGAIDVEPPFDRHRGEAPAMSARDIDDVVAFLGTLTDGFSPSPPLRHAGLSTVSR